MQPREAPERRAVDERNPLGLLELRAAQQEGVGSDHRLRQVHTHEAQQLDVLPSLLRHQERGDALLEGARLDANNTVYRVSQWRKGVSLIQARLQVLSLLDPRRPLQYSPQRE